MAKTWDYIAKQYIEGLSKKEIKKVVPKVSKKKHMDDYKKEIIKYVLTNQVRLAKEFIPSRKKEFMKKALVEKNWVRTFKGALHYDYEIVHEFNCTPYNNELHAYVYTTPDELSIENVIVQTE